MTVTITFVGTGDAFGSGGRMNTCILVDADEIRFAIDFGATTPNALNNLGIAHNSIDQILLTHLHGDHFAGLPTMLMDSMLGSKRESPLTIAGPVGTEAHLGKVVSALFPGSETMTPKFPLTILELETMRQHDVGGLKVTTYPAIHTKQTNPTSIRIEVAGKVIAYTGDSAWNEHIPTLAHEADLLVSECYFHSKPVPFHMNYIDIEAHRDELSARRLVLTHMGPEMLARQSEVPEECAHDGLVIEI